jgi:hypothetical protein
MLLRICGEMQKLLVMTVKSAVGIFSLLCLVASAGCSKPSNSESQGEGSVVEFVNLRVLGSPLEVRIPPTWKVENLAPPPVPPRTTPEPGAAVVLHGRKIFSARSPKGVRGEVAAPRIEVFHDPWLPVGTGASDYLAAQRASNEVAVDHGPHAPQSKIRHVEAESTRRQGRPAYHVRDEWNLRMGDDKATVTQESLLLIDALDNELHGYTVVVTAIAEDRAELESTIASILNSVAFSAQ